MWAGLVRIAVASFLLALPLKSEARCCRLTRTNFGYLRVSRRDVPLATEIGEGVSRAAKEVLHLQRVRFIIVDAHHSRYHWGDLTAARLPVYPWSFVHGTDYVAVQPPNSILPHEIGHDLFRRYVVPDTHPGQYGTDAPDWLDEAVAVAFETPEDQAERRCEASSLLKAHALIPLRRYLAMSHPELAAIPNAARGGARGPRFLPGSATSKETPAFYALSIAFPEYLAARAHSASVLADVIGAFRAGKPIDTWIVSQIAGFRTDDDLQAMDEDFQAWLGSDKRYQCNNM